MSHDYLLTYIIYATLQHFTNFLPLTFCQSNICNYISLKLLVNTSCVELSVDHNYMCVFWVFDIMQTPYVQYKGWG